MVPGCARPPIGIGVDSSYAPDLGRRNQFFFFFSLSSFAEKVVFTLLERGRDHGLGLRRVRPHGLDLQISLIGLDSPRSGDGLTIVGHRGHADQGDSQLVLGLAVIGIGLANDFLEGFYCLL